MPSTVDTEFLKFILKWIFRLQIKEIDEGDGRNHDDPHLKEYKERRSN